MKGLFPRNKLRMTGCEYAWLLKGDGLVRTGTIVVMLLLGLAFVLPAVPCAAGGEPDAAYQVDKELYRYQDAEKELTISYPQLFGLEDAEKQAAINQLLRSKAMRQGEYRKSPDFEAGKVKSYPNHFLAFVDYEVKWQSANLLSVKFWGMYQYPGTPHPNHFLQAVNIDVASASELRLTDLAVIDESFGFAEKYQAGKFVPVRPGIQGRVVFANDAANDSGKIVVLTDEYLVGWFTQAGGSFYFTKDSLGLIVPAPHPFGDFEAFEIRYEDFAENMKTEHPAWKDFLPGR